MRVDDVRSLSLFEGLSDDQLAELLSAGAEVAIEPGVELFHEGEHADSWWVLVDGAINLWRRVGREDTVVGRMDVPGRWAGGFQAWDEHGVYLASGRGVVAGRVLQVPATVLRDLSSAWFPFAGHLIQGLYRTARTIEATARQRESLVTLGTLAAGLAHELNNPAAAATRAVATLEGASQTLLTSLTRLAGGEISAAQFSALDALRREVLPRTTVLDPVDVADAEELLSAWLDAHGVERGWTFAPTLAGAGLDLAWCERAAAALPGTELGPGLEWVASTLSVATLLGEVKESTRRVSELVAAMRSYSQMDRGSLQQLDVMDGLESTLVMLGHKLHDGVTVTRAYASDVPQIQAYAGELNQVWTNLIDNAVDAMGGTGTLTISTRSAGAQVVVEIGDTGPGMPPEVAARAFEAFFTTKDVGKGTGLGLDIAQRIVVQRHGGTIDIDSGPGGTIFRVGLPVNAPATTR
jgi:signal transduction histidine kinase